MDTFCRVMATIKIKQMEQYKQKNIELGVNLIKDIAKTVSANISW